MQIMYNIISPIVKSIKIVERDSLSISEVPSVFNNIESKIQNINLGNLVTKEEVNGLQVEN